MMRYAMLNLLFLFTLVVVFVIYKPVRLNRRFWAYVSGLLLLTIVFDNLLVGAGIVAYHWEYTLGVKIGTFPVEDVAYTLAACVLIPVLWKYYDRH